MKSSAKTHSSEILQENNNKSSQFEVNVKTLESGKNRMVKQVAQLLLRMS